MSLKTMILLATTIAAESLPVAMQVYSDGRAKLMREPGNPHALAQTAIGGGMLALSFHFVKEGAKLEQLKHGTAFIKTTVATMLRGLDKAPSGVKAGGVPPDLDPAADVWPTPPMPPVPPGKVDIRSAAPWMSPGDVERLAQVPPTSTSTMFRTTPSTPVATPAAAEPSTPPVTPTGMQF